MNKDVFFLQKTFELASRARGFTSPNPLVGAVIVAKGRIIGSGYHKRAGMPHAEVEALRRAKGSVKGATLYVNIEPCCHFGKTPPCVDTIISSGIKRVVMATLDPNPIVKGKSVRKLKKARVKVDVGLCRKEALKLNEIFFKNMTQRIPFVAAKTAQSLDGKIATASGRSKWITSSASREAARALRDDYDCVLVGINTTIQDNPLLSGVKKMPFKVVIDPNLRIPLNCKVIKNNPERLIIFTSSRHKKKAWRMTDSVNVFFLDNKQGGFNLATILKKLYSLNIRSVFVEGGARTLGGFFDARLVDKIYFFYAPKIIGGEKALGSVGGRGAVSPVSALNVKDMEMDKLDDGFLVTGYPS